MRYLVTVRYIAFWAIACLLSSSANAQNLDFENIRVAQDGTRLVVTYDLVSSDPNATFTVALYSSHNNFASPVLSVTGAVGKGQKPGVNKRIEWEMRTDLQVFHGQISVELGGVSEIVKLDFRKPFMSNTAKQGKEVTITWLGGTNHPNVKLDIYRDGKLVSSLGEKKNNGTFIWKVPVDHETGDGFTLRLSSDAEHVESGPFAIKGKSNKMLVVGSAAAATSAAVILWLIYRPLPEAPDHP